MIRLVRPTVKYKKSFLKGSKEFKIGERSRDKGKLNDDFHAFITKMRDYEKGKNLPKGYVVSSYYWLMDGKSFIGETTIRHKLTKALLKEGGHIGYEIRPTKRKKGYGEKILSLVLKKVKKLGIKKALVTCDDDNIGSSKIIESNGGVLENKIKYGGKLIRRYWIKI